MKKYRNYSDEFKQELIMQIDSGRITVAEAAREHDIAPSLIDRWRKQIHEGTMRPKKSKREKELEKELEKYKIKVAELTLANDFLKKFNEEQRTKKSIGLIITPRKSAQSEERAK